MNRLENRNQIPQYLYLQLYNYLIYGRMPSLWCYELLTLSDQEAQTLRVDTTEANDFSNKRLAVSKWIEQYAPPESFGSTQAVSDWMMDRNGLRSEYANRADRFAAWCVLSNNNSKEIYTDAPEEYPISTDGTYNTYE